MQPTQLLKSSEKIPSHLNTTTKSQKRLGSNPPSEMDLRAFTKSFIPYIAFPLMVNLITPSPGLVDISAVLTTGIIGAVVIISLIEK